MKSRGSILVFDNFINTLSGKSPALVFMGLEELTLKYSCINILLAELQNYLNDINDNVALQYLEILKTDMKKSLERYGLD